MTQKKISAEESEELGREVVFTIGDYLKYLELFYSKYSSEVQIPMPKFRNC